MRLELPISAVIAIPVVVFIFENIIGTIVATEGAKIVGDYILLTRVFRGGSIKVGQKWGLSRILNLTFSVLASIVTAIGIASVQPLQKGEIVWSRSLRNEALVIQQNNLASVNGILTFSQLQRKKQASILKDKDVCVIEHGTAYLKDDGSGAGVRILRSKGMEMTRSLAGSSHDGSEWLSHQVQEMFLSVGDGPEAKCIEVTEEIEQKSIDELTWEGDLGGIPATDKLYCFTKGKYTVVRRENGRVKEKYMHVGRGSKYFRTFITKKNIPIALVFEFAEKGLGGVCRKMAEEEKFVPETTDKFWISVFPKDEDPVYVIRDNHTSIHILYLIPGFAAVLFLSVIYLLRAYKGYTIRLSQEYWIVRLLIDHYERIGSCANPKEMRQVGITDTDLTSQHLGVLEEQISVARDRIKSLKGL